MHLIGLSETKKGSKKLIERQKEGHRNNASLIENAIDQLDSLDKLSRLENPGRYGGDYQEQLFNVALELAITWVNRILFLKLLEAQLISYHKGDRSYAFLNSEMIKNFDDLNSLFFSVLARKTHERSDDVKKLFAGVPYLNSSLFEPTELEHACFFISQLKDGKMPLITSTVLKDNFGKRRTGELPIMKYFFEFLNAYDFAGEGDNENAEENKTLINASVLGLIFEKINGYKDGSFFTPGFITMYMCRETIRRAVVQKFNDAKGWKCVDIDDLYDKIEDRAEANRIINSLKICDPAVGSGHFLVSALNEIIAVKSELKVLLDREGKRLKEYQVEVVNDELVVTDDDGDIFKYNPNSAESRRVQETLFHEKQSIIENCLFGVDINPNSVKICRLRLWIELLKNAYYKSIENELETLPNIDINIKYGNSLISRFALDADIKQALRKSKWTIESYRMAVMAYRNAAGKEEKRGLVKLIEDIKKDFRSEVSRNDKRKIKLDKLNDELFHLTKQGNLFEMSKAEKASREKEVKVLVTAIEKLELELEEIKSNKIFENAFEWRFEFPEVLNDDGDFVGFDVVIGNPPYLNFKIYTQEERNIFRENFNDIFDGKADIYYFFFGIGVKILKANGLLSYITSRYWIEAEFAMKLRFFIASQTSIEEIVDFKNVTIFDGIGIKTAILNLQNCQPTKEKTFKYKYIDCKKIDLVNIVDFSSILITNENIKEKKSWLLGVEDKLNIYSKIETNTISLDEIAYCKQGIVTGLDKAFVSVSKEFEYLPKEFVKKWIKVGDIFKYSIIPVEDRQLVYTNEIKDISLYPELENRLSYYKAKLSERREAKSGKIRWFDLQWGRDQALFMSPKLVCRFKAAQNTFALDENNCYSSADTTIVVLKKIWLKNLI